MPVGWAAQPNPASAAPSSPAHSPVLPCPPFRCPQVLGEMQRRGVSRDALVACLREMGREMPAASVRMLQVRRLGWPALAVLVPCEAAEVAAGGRLDSAHVHSAAGQPQQAAAAFAQAHAPHPAGSLPLPRLQWAARRGLDVTILSDCNQTFM